MPKKVLLICNYFAPDNTIAAVRTSKIAKYLKMNGYEIEVITEKKQNVLKDEILENEVKGITIHYANNSNRIIKLLELYQKLIRPVKQKKYNDLSNRKKINPQTGNVEFYPFETAYPLIGSLDYIVGLIKQFDLFISIKKDLKNYEEVEYVITSYGDFFSIFAGKYFHKEHKNSSWIFDIRDSICRYKFTPKYVRWIAKKYERYIWKEADCIIAVSKGICKQIPCKYRKKIHCITNGFDLTDREGIISENHSMDKLVFTYTGSMYGGLQDLSPLFKCIKDLIKQSEIDRNRIEFHYAGNETAYGIFSKQAQLYGLEENCVFCGKVTRRESLQLQIQSHVLLVSAFDYQMNEGGIITGKALEYMSANKPIVAIITGDIAHSELATIIREGNLGVAYEEHHKEQDYKELRKYIKEKYFEFVNDGYVSHKPNAKVLQKFDYKNIGKKLIKIMENI